MLTNLHKDSTSFRMQLDEFVFYWLYQYLTVWKIQGDFAMKTTALNWQYNLFKLKLLIADIFILGRLI